MSARAVLALAGLADAAVRGLHPVSVREQLSTSEDVDAALVTDSEQRLWLVRAPRTFAAGARLEAEGRLLTVLAGRLPFGVPEVVGTAPMPGGGRAVVSRHLPGVPLDLDRVPPGSPLPAELGRTIAAVHDVPPSVLEDAGMPVYAAEEYRLRRLAEVDRAASTGHVPPPLLTRWEHALEEAGAWRFSPCTVHGDLAGESVLVEGSSVTGVLDWAQARVADPADDLSWLVVGLEPELVDAALAAYSTARHEAVDADLVRRARLAGELAVARWLLHGAALDDDEIVADAEEMLKELLAAVADSPW